MASNMQLAIAGNGAGAGVGAGVGTDVHAMTREERAEAAVTRRFRALDDACCLVDQSLAQDENQPELYELLAAPSSRKYTSEPYVLPDPADSTAAAPWRLRPQLVQTEARYLPQAIKDKYRTCEVHTFMGLFPEVHRAFVVFDNTLMLWNYDHNDVDTTFDELDQVIVSVALVVPRPDAFNDFVKFVLVIATSVQVVLLAVTFEDDDISNKMSLRPTHVEYPTDGVGIIQIVGSTDGRIFLGGTDGCVYELIYHEERGMLQHLISYPPPTRKVNLTSSRVGSIVRAIAGSLLGATGSPIIQMVADHHRGLVYTLSENGTIEGYDLGARGDEFRLFGRSTISELRGKYAALTALVSLAVIPPTQSHSIHLVAVSVTGFRVFFTVHRLGQYDARRDNRSWVRGRVASRLYATHFRPPPAGAELKHFKTIDSGSPSKVHNVHTAFLSSDVSIMAAVQPPPKAARGKALRSWGQDMLVGATHDPLIRTGPTVRGRGIGRNALTMTESVHQLNLVYRADTGPELLGIGKVHAIAQAPPPSVMTRVEMYTLSGARSGLDFLMPAELTDAPDSAQVGGKRPASLIAGATSRSVFDPSYGQDRPPVILNELATQHDPAFIRTYLVLSSEGLLQYQKLRPVDQLTQILRSSAHREENRALQQFFQHFNHAEACSMCLVVATSQPGMLRSAAISAYLQFGGHPHFRQLTSTTARAELSKDIVYSPKVFGLCLYMARLLRPVWRWSIITFADATADPRRGRSRHAKTGLYPHRRFDSDELRRVARPLAELRNVLESIYDTLGRDDDDDYLDEEPTTAQHLQALKEGAAGRSGAGAGAGAGAVSSSANNKAVRVEHGYVRSLYRLLDRCVQALNLLAVVFETRPISTLLKRLKPDVAKQLLDMDFRAFVVTRKALNVSHEMVQELMKQLHPNGREAAKLASKLRSQAHDFFSEGENLLCLAQQALFRVDSVSADSDKLAALEESCEKLKLAAKCWDVDRSLPALARICRGYCKHGFYRGVVWAALTAAYYVANGDVETFPPAALTDSAALTTTNTSLPIAVRRVQQRLRCYCNVFAMLHWVKYGPSEDLFDDEGSTTTWENFLSSGTIVVNDAAAAGAGAGAGAGADGSQSTAEVRHIEFLRRLQEVLLSPDVLFHDRLYSSLQRTQPAVLVSLRSPLLLGFLKHRADDPELLYKYYLSHQSYREAALLKRRQATTVLPDKDGKLPTLDQRCQDLSKAIELAKEPAVRLSGGITGEELAVWEMDLEIAIIQSRIYESIKQNTSGAVPEAERATHVQELGSTLQSLKTLYTKYARDYDLHAESIAILNLRRLPSHVSRVEQHWEAIIKSKLTPAHLANPPRTVIAGVQDEITSVVRRLNIRDSTAFAFPMRHICWFLERTFTLGQYGARVAEAAKRDPAWVLKILAAEHMRIPWISRFYVYYELCTQKEIEDEMKLRYMRVLQCLMRSWLDAVKHDHDPRLLQEVDGPTQKVLELKALLQESFTLDTSVMKEMNEGFKAVEIARDELRQLWMNA